MHGFGFAGVLAEMALPRGRLVPALVGFNVGVELGQLAVVALGWTLLALIERHADCTQSPRARWVLENWETMRPKFIKIFPHEYKRVLGVPRLQEAAHA